ncbi:taste receptor type 2 member 10-like [Lacerta agilis]|uniref:taste receptor type 2 member 10-like n=1 Tax=Lacerta agilis TaxID=80427 RepID=UPI001419C8A6|nr:taste receptor type 2 member 10-like [Lacerta agilis]
MSTLLELFNFVLLVIVTFTGMVLDVVLVWVDTKDDWVTIIVFNLIAAYSSGHAVILIFVNPKLKQESIKMLHQLQC